MGLDVAAQRLHGRLALLVLLILAGVGSSLQGSLVLPLTRRDGGLFARGLLRAGGSGPHVSSRAVLRNSTLNTTMPLHGAVKDYG